MPTAVERQSQNPIMTIGGDLREIPILSFSFEVISPRDAQTGMATGKRQWKPIVVTKQWDATSPKLYHAAVSNESLSNVKIGFADSWLTFTNAKFISFRHTPQQGRNVESFTFVFEDVQTGKGAAGRPAQDDWEVNEVMFAFQKISLKWTGGKTSAADDWTQ